MQKLQKKKKIKDKEIRFINLVIRLWKKISTKRKIQFFLILILMILSAIAEVISIGTVIPFLSLLTNSQNFLENNQFRYFISFFGFDASRNLILLVTLVFISSALISGFIRILNLWATYQYSCLIGCDLSSKVFKRTLYQDYEDQISNNSSDLIAKITSEMNLVVATINRSLVFLTSLITLFFVSITLLFIRVDLALFISFLLFLTYRIIVLNANNRLLKYSKKISRNLSLQVRNLQESFGAIRDVIMTNKQQFYVNNYGRNEYELRRAQANASFLETFPRLLIDPIFIMIIALSSTVFSEFFNLTSDNLIPIMGGLVLGAQRLLPSLQLTYSCWAKIKSISYSVRNVLELLELPFDQNKCLSSCENRLIFKKNIVFKNVSFKYKKSNDFIIKNISLNINKGEKVGIIGATGSGKSTLLDLLIGLLKPTSGEIFVDDQNINMDSKVKYNQKWKNSISHVSQSIFLSDKSISQNIGFGFKRDEIDFNELIRVSKIANIEKFINKLPAKYETIIGEKGINLSGGQIQRIGIARALYDKSNILVFDEATSSLDNLTEKSVIKALNSLNRETTLIMVAHRLSTLIDCDKVFEIKNGEIINIYGKDDIFKKLQINNS